MFTVLSDFVPCFVCFLSKLENIANFSQIYEKVSFSSFNRFVEWQHCSLLEDVVLQRPLWKFKLSFHQKKVCEVWQKLKGWIKRTLVPKSCLTSLHTASVADYQNSCTSSRRQVNMTSLPGGQLGWLLGSRSSVELCLNLCFLATQYKTYQHFHLSRPYLHMEAVRIVMTYMLTFIHSFSTSFVNGLVCFNLYFCFTSCNS